jgi:serine/threonine protein kinase
VTLATRLKKGRMEPDEALGFCLQIATALEAAHEQHVIHRDLKPSNVMIGPRGGAKVLDFGLATRVRETPRPTATTLSLTQGEIDAAARVGTPGYMSPEQVLGTVQDARTDVFSFGCVLYECLAGRRAFDRSDTSDLLAAALAAEPDWSALPARTPRAAHVLLKRCLQKEPSRRTEMAEVRRELESIVRCIEARRLDTGPDRGGARIAPGTHNLPHEASGRSAPVSTSCRRHRWSR